MRRPLFPALLGLAVLSTVPLAHATGTAAAAVQPAMSSPAAAAAAAPVEPVPPPKTPKIREILKAMGKASTRGHPDLFGEFAGMQNLFRGNYAQALKYFKIGARYADKVSQYSIGMMYFNGRGVHKDPATACAWLALAAQRKYARFVQAHHFMCASLTPAQRSQAAAVLATLLPQYGDAVAKQRMALALANDRRALTGSHVGHDFGVISAPPPSFVGGTNNSDSCGDTVMHLGAVNIPSSCGRYNPALLDPHTYFAARDAQFKATVTVGPLQDTTASGSGTRAEQSGDNPTPAPASSSGP